MARLHRLLRDAWAMAVPSWRSEERWVARALLVSDGGLNLGMSTSTSCSTSGAMRCSTRTTRCWSSSSSAARHEGGHHGAVELRYVSTGADGGRAAPLHVELLDTDAPPGGIGVPGVPPVAPAIANAIFVLTGQRTRTLPLMLAGVA